MEYQPPVGGDPNDSYVNGNPATGTEGSIPPAEAIEQPMREIVNAIAAAGLTPDDNDLSQLADAIGTMAGLGVTMANAAGSPVSLTAGDAGLVMIDASSGNVTINLPGASARAAARFTFVRTDTTGNSVTVNSDGGDTIAADTSMSISAGNRRNLVSDGVDTWHRTAPIGVTINDQQTGTDYELVMNNGVLMTQEI